MRMHQMMQDTYQITRKKNNKYIKMFQNAMLHNQTKNNPGYLPEPIKSDMDIR